MAIGKTSADSGKNTPINRQIGGTVPRRKIPAQTDNKNTGRDGTRQIKQMISQDIQLAGIALPQGNSIKDQCNGYNHQRNQPSTPFGNSIRKRQMISGPAPLSLIKGSGDKPVKIRKSGNPEKTI